MDALSSMGSIAGYKCALIAADSLGKYVPMLSSAAGTTKAANVLVLGVAVAGLQAIAIMNRLGGEVFAYDIRPETKEQAAVAGRHLHRLRRRTRGRGEEDEFVEYEPTGFGKLMASLGFYSFAEPPQRPVHRRGRGGSGGGRRTSRKRAGRRRSSKRTRSSCANA